MGTIFPLIERCCSVSVFTLTFGIELLKVCLIVLNRRAALIAMTGSFKATERNERSLQKFIRGEIFNGRVWAAVTAATNQLTPGEAVVKAFQTRRRVKLIANIESAKGWIPWPQHIAN